MGRSRWHHWQFTLAFLVAPLAWAAATGCGSSGDGSTFDEGDKADATTGHADGGSISLGDDGGGIGFGGGVGGGSFNASTFALTPLTTTLNITDGVDAGVQTVQFQATDNGVALNGAAYSVSDRNELGTIDVKTGLFTPTGSLGGTATVEADYEGAKATATVTIQRHAVANGATDALTSVPVLTDGGVATAVSYFGPGGYGGVGGDGSGGAVTAAQQAALDAASGTSTGDDWLYPYDQTVFPRDILAPLLQWSTTSSDYDAVKIHLQEANYEYTGYFGKPVLATTFGDHPIPADVWTNVYSSYTSATAKEDVTVTVTLLPKGGSAAFALAPRTWHIAGGELRGKIYYQSYGTHLATQAFGARGGGAFGGATLAISPGAAAPDPTPAAGGTSTDNSGCRVCHSVASGGSALITQHGDNSTSDPTTTSYGVSSYYDLINKTPQQTIPPGKPNSGPNNQYPGISPDGTVLLSDTALSGGSSAFYDVPSGTPVAGMTGVPTTLNAFFPSFSPDGKSIAYDDGTANTLMLAGVDLTAKVFTPPTSPLFTPPSGTHAYWPSFMPASDGVVFHLELVYNTRDVGGTRASSDGATSGTHAELWYVNLKTGKAHRLDALNGDTATGTYLPPHPTAAAADVNADAQFNYEPTVNPVVSGGYAWIVFTSRRRYGNVATINPFDSDPRFTDITKTPTTKKLWVAAIDLSADGTADASFPAFYLPGQELLAGNARGFWVVDPCQADGTSCATGDQCCGGYCQPAGDGGALVCSDVKPTCAAQLDKCATANDCCDDTLQCIGGRCSVPGPR